MTRSFALAAVLLVLAACSDPRGDSGSGATDGGDGGGTGGSGGTSGAASGGSGGNPAVDCEEDSDCSPMTPHCNAAGDCVSCTSNTACEDRGPLAHCEMTLGSDRRGQCVECLDDDHCEGNDQGDYCLNNTCVPCKTNAHCTDLTKPQCSPEGQCVGCTHSDACEGRDGTEACVTTPGPKRGHCVACVTNSNCASLDAPQCKPDNTCGACTSDDACEGRDGAEHCNLRADAETFGNCVECTADSEDVCNGNSCKQTTGECTEVGKNSVAVCGACQADSECSTGAKCVRHEIGGEAIGTFCFYTYEANDGCADTRPAAKPYSQTLANTLSIDSTDASQQASYCLPATSCAAIADATTFMGAPGAEPCSVSSDCGIGDPEVDGAFCIPADFSTEAARNKCSYACTTSSDCASSGFDMCPGGGLKFCQ